MVPLFFGWCSWRWCVAGNLRLNICKQSHMHVVQQSHTHSSYSHDVAERLTHVIHICFLDHCYHRQTFCDIFWGNGCMPNILQHCSAMLGARPHGRFVGHHHPTTFVLLRTTNVISYWYLINQRSSTFHWPKDSSKQRGEPPLHLMKNKHLNSHRYLSTVRMKIH